MQRNSQRKPAAADPGYRPYNEQEERDRAILLKWMESGCDILTLGK